MCAQILWRFDRLGEGYNNPYIAISVFIHPPISVSRLSQYHGRAVRKLPVSAGLKKHPRAMEAYLFYPKVRTLRRFSLKAPPMTAVHPA